MSKANTPQKNIPIERIRNFSIIAHIDHGKSTLADRMLEKTGTISEREMKEQVLDSMELERERGITIKMQPVRIYHEHKGEEYMLNLIDTPGHIDFSYEVSRALKAVEGSLLLVDATQGVQAQTLTTLNMAREAGLLIIPVLSKVDSPRARIEDVSLELMELLDCELEEIRHTSGKTGEGVLDLLANIIETVPAPEKGDDDFQALIFDFEYSEHQGIILYVRVMGGEVARNDSLTFNVAKKKFRGGDVGFLSPTHAVAPSLKSGEVGYIVTGIKQAGFVSVGDTVHKQGGRIEPLTGYQKPIPVVWASLYPHSQDDFDMLRTALGRLQLSDASISYEEETSGTLGRGFRCGFLGMLHLEIITERLTREFKTELIVTSPSVTYEVTKRGGEILSVYSAHNFPDHGDIVSTREPWVELTIMTPGEYISGIVQVLFDHEALTKDSRTLPDGRTEMIIEMPLRELMRNFFDEIKSVTSGYASVAYVMVGLRDANVTRMDILVAEEAVPAFAQVISEPKAQSEARVVVDKLKKVLPRQMFTIKIQGRVRGKVVASASISALRKDVTGHLYGGDITRKMKLREKQKKGKKRMAEQGKVNIPQKVFMQMVMRSED